MTCHTYAGQQYLYNGVMPKGAKTLTDADRQTIIDALYDVRTDFEMRLNSYLKRYGTSKIKAWSYWRD